MKYAIISIILSLLSIIPQHAYASPVTTPEASLPIQMHELIPAMEQYEFKPIEVLAPVRIELANACRGGCGYERGQCTHHAAIVREQMGKPVGNDWGDAKNWIASAQADGVPTGSEPEVGAVAVNTAGVWGHVAVVEEVKPDGSYVVTEGNFDYMGSVRERVLPPDAPYEFVYE